MSDATSFDESDGSGSNIPVDARDSAEWLQTSQEVVTGTKTMAEAQQRHVLATDNWRKMNKARIMKNRKEIEKVSKKLDKEMERNIENYATHTEGINQLNADLNTQKDNHDALYRKIVEIKDSHNSHKTRMDILEQKQVDHVQTLEQVTGQNKWIVPVVAGIGITGAIAAIVWLASYFIGTKKSGKDHDSSSDDEIEDGTGRFHARAWKIAPEVHSERHAGKYSDSLRARGYYV